MQQKIDCPECRRRYEMTHDPAGRRIVHTPIGMAKVYVTQGDRETLVDTARSYTDLRRIVEALQIGTTFAIVLEINGTVVGDGQYERTGQGTSVRHEDGACEELHVAMAVLPILHFVK